MSGLLQPIGPIPTSTTPRVETPDSSAFDLARHLGYCKTWDMGRYHYKMLTSSFPGPGNPLRTRRGAAPLRPNATLASGSSGRNWLGTLRLRLWLQHRLLRTFWFTPI